MTILDCEERMVEADLVAENKVLKGQLEEAAWRHNDDQSQIAALKKEIAMFKQSWDSWSGIMLAQMDQFRDDWMCALVDSDDILPYIDNWKSFIHNGSDEINQQIQKAFHLQ